MLNVQHHESFSMRLVLYQVQNLCGIKFRNLCCIKLRDLCCIKYETYVVLISWSFCSINIGHCVASSPTYERCMYYDLVLYQYQYLVLYQCRNLMLYQDWSLMLYQDWSCVISWPYMLCCIKIWLVLYQLVKLYYVMYY